MKLVGAAGQIARHPLYRADGSITAGGAAQLVLPQRQSCTFLMLQNLANEPLYFEFGAASATAALTSGAVSSITVVNGGFGFTVPPLVEFLGGGNPQSSAFVGCGQPGYPSPSHPAKAHAVLTGGAVSSIVIDDPGIGYAVAPYVHIYNNPLDPIGCSKPSATSGFSLASGSAPYILNGTMCTTDPIAVYGATTGSAFLCRWSD